MDFSGLHELTNSMPITKADLIRERAKMDTKIYSVEGRYSFNTKNRDLNDIINDLRSLPKVAVISTDPDDKEKQKKDRQTGDITIRISDEFEMGPTNREKLIGGVLNQANEVPGVLKIKVDPQQIKTVVPDEETRGR